MLQSNWDLRCPHHSKKNAVEGNTEVQASTAPHPPLPPGSLPTHPPSQESLEDRLEGGTLVILHLLHEVLELLVFLSHLWMAVQQVLALDAPGYDEEVVAEVVQLVAGAVGPFFKYRTSFFSSFFLMGPSFRGFFFLGPNPSKRFPFPLP